MAKANPTKITTSLIIIVTMIITICVELDGRELRPSDHGLEYQTSPQGKTSHEMTSFFGDGGVPSSDVALPKATNSSDASWWNSAGSHGGGGGGGGDHVRRVVLVASVACGITGVALLLAAGFVYVRWNRKQREQASPAPTSSPPRQQPLFDVHKK